ncbi:MAG: ATP synthase F1 subunit gamma [Flavobacteriales bacterium]|jgi:F-type H+-transporting ATPase subunit gamma|nr:ATP synthase F1 subunit gamma [Flavobacteriales bacterium]
MGGLKEVKDRITSVQSTIQITSAMKMVSAAKLKRAQDAIIQMRPYAEKLTEILVNVSSTLDTSEGGYSVQREMKNLLIIPIASNRGLCGPFNSNVIKATRALQKKYEGCEITILAAGKKADDAFKGTEENIHGNTLPRNMNNLFNELAFTTVSLQAERIMEAFIQKQFDKVVIIYNQFKNAAVQNVQVEQWLPAVAPEAEEKSTFVSDYIYEPSKSEIVEELIPKSLKTQFYKAFLDSHASEHGARMTAMHKATDNATEMVDDLKLVYNKARQAAITNEILEIVGGAEALND